MTLPPPRARRRAGVGQVGKRRSMRLHHRPNHACVIQSTDGFVDRDGIVYCTDYNGGLYIMEYLWRMMVLSRAAKGSGEEQPANG